MLTSLLACSAVTSLAFACVKGAVCWTLIFFALFHAAAALAVAPRPAPENPEQGSGLTPEHDFSEN